MPRVAPGNFWGGTKHLLILNALPHHLLEVTYLVSEVVKLIIPTMGF